MRRLFCQIFWIFLILIAAGCKNPFATREAEPPTTDQSSWRLPTDPAIVLENMRLAFYEKNVENYMKCLSDSQTLFRFIPDEYEASNSAGTFEQWNLAYEQTYIKRLFTSIPADSSNILKFTPDQRLEFADSVFIRTDYSLELHHVLPAVYPRSAKGKADFWFMRHSGYWVITRWEDYETIIDSASTRLPSWSTIKAVFLN
ncbi:MAG TPA: hypothetical protein ENN22_04595 [bacterium]|nr:hypothetical protein [bacterium]